MFDRNRLCTECVQQRDELFQVDRLLSESRSQLAELG